MQGAYVNGGADTGPVAAQARRGGRGVRTRAITSASSADTSPGSAIWLILGIHRLGDDGGEAAACANLCSYYTIEALPVHADADVFNG